MPALLALDTSTPTGNVAVGDGERILSEVTLGAATRHAEALLPAIRFALNAAGLDLTAITGVVVGGGPGSFTGVRIAAATAKGLARARGLPFFAYSSLLALAASAGTPGRPVCSLLDARRGEVYGACYDWDPHGRPRALVPPRTCRVEEIVKETAMMKPLYAGEGALRYRDRLPQTAAVAPAYHAFPRAAALLWLAARHPGDGLVAAPARWQPEYLRASGAERGVRG